MEEICLRRDRLESKIVPKFLADVTGPGSIKFPAIEIAVDEILER